MPLIKSSRSRLLNQPHSGSLIAVVGILCCFVFTESAPSMNEVISGPRTSPRTVSPSSTAAGRRFDCTKNKDGEKVIQRTESLNKQVKEGIDEARNALQTCKSCWNLMGARENPLMVLDSLVKDDAIVITHEPPQLYHISAENKPAGVDIPKRFEPNIIARAMYTLADDGEILGRCIYVNPIQLLASAEADIRDVKFEGLTVRQARGLIILHELAHLMHAIQIDIGDSKKGDENTKCVRSNCCVPCFPTACPNAPVRPSKRHRNPGRRLDNTSGLKTSVLREEPHLDHSRRRTAG